MSGRNIPGGYETWSKEDELRALLATVTAERDALRALVERYGADQWRRGNAGKEPQEFAEWQKEAQS